MSLAETAATSRKVLMSVDGAGLGLGTVFQICADGSSYAVLKRFLGPAALGSPDGGLLRTSDGTLYGVGHAPYGPIFSVLPPAVILTPTRVQNDWKIRILGIPGRTYSLQRKASIASAWEAAGAVSIGESGTIEITDTNAPGGTAFYRTSAQ